jgi:hypothetical protein
MEVEDVEGGYVENEWFEGKVWLPSLASKNYGMQA